MLLHAACILLQLQRELPAAAAAAVAAVAAVAAAAAAGIVFLVEVSMLILGCVWKGRHPG